MVLPAVSMEDGVGERIYVGNDVGSRYAIRRSGCWLSRWSSAWKVT